MSELIDILDNIDVELNALDTCQYKHAVFSQKLSAVQRLVDHLVLNNYSNLKDWIEKLDNTVLN